jgi:hypothetical protein
VVVRILEYLTEEDYAIAASNGISRKRAYQRFYDNGWEKECAITRRIGASRWSIYREKCEANGITQQRFNDRIRRGRNLEEAATTPLYKRKSDMSYEKKNLEGKLFHKEV